MAVNTALLDPRSGIQGAIRMPICRVGTTWSMSKVGPMRESSKKASQGEKNIDLLQDQQQRVNASASATAFLIVQIGMQFADYIE